MGIVLKMKGGTNTNDNLRNIINKNTKIIDLYNLVKKK